MNSNPFSFLEPLFVAPTDYGVGGRIPALLRAVGTGLRLATLALLLAEAVAVWRSRLHPAARREAVFNLSILISLVLSPVVWAHYLSLVFPLLATVLALGHRLPRPAMVLTGAIIGLSMFQHRIVMLQYEAHIGSGSVAANVGAGMIKSLPMLLILALVLIWRRALAEGLADPAWAEIGPGDGRGDR